MLNITIQFYEPKTPQETASTYIRAMYGKTLAEFAQDLKKKAEDSKE